MQRKQELEDELRRLGDFLAMYEKLMGPVGHLEETLASVSEPQEARELPERGFTELSEPVPVAPGFPEAQEAPEARLPSGTPRMSNKAFVALAREILIENGFPLEKNDLLRKIHERGRRVGGSNEADTLKGKLWRTKDEIVRIPGAGLWPADVPCEAVSYNPFEK